MQDSYIHMWDLTTLHTKQLLKMLQRVRRFDGVMRDCSQVYVLYTAKGIKAELANRPHVPNKQEARKIRQAKAKR